jgi:hypothetical protein
MVDVLLPKKKRYITLAAAGSTKNINEFKVHVQKHNRYGKEETPSFCREGVLLLPITAVEYGTQLPFC